MLNCAIIPLVKDKNGKLDDSNNYRGIGLSCLLLKIVDWTILTLYEDELAVDETQFGYQPKTSCSMLSWTVIELINAFARGGSPVYACLLDYRKAFDFVNHEKMFDILVNRNVNLVFLRLLIVIYINQKCYVKWNGTRSYSFNVTNGTRQGAVFSPRGGFNTYLHELQQDLRKSGYGLQLGTKWYGGLFWADDGILLSTSVQGLQHLVDICESHATATDLIFSTDADISKSKTVCIAFNCPNSENLSSVVLNGNPLPWKKTVKHVGVTLNSNGTMESDLKEKRARFIQRSMELNEEFECLTPECKQKLHRLYNNDFSGSSCWNYDDRIFQQLLNSYNVNMRIVFNIPRETHCWIVERISGGHHAKQQIYSRCKR